jgi:DNA modification methylase
VHCKQLVDYKGRDGRAGMRDFRGDIIRAFEESGWKYHSEVCIWKDPVIEMQRTKAHGLLYKQLRADSSFSRQGMAEYLCTFRKWAAEGDAIEPITHTPDSFNLPDWQEIASPVWTTIRQTIVLNVRIARESQDEKHLCPLQLDVIERALRLWSNPGDLVLSPFAGIGSEGYISLKMGRQFVGCELKEAYYNQAARNLSEVEHEAGQSTIFDIMGE